VLLAMPETAAARSVRPSRRALFFIFIGLIAVASWRWWTADNPVDRDTARQPDVGRPSSDVPRSLAATPQPSDAAVAHRDRAGELPIAAHRSAAELMFSARTAVDGLRLARERFGQGSYAVNSAMQTVRALCGSPIDPSGSLHHDEADPTRDWVIESIVSYCEGWTAEAFKAIRSVDAPTSLHRVLREQGEAAAIDLAHQQIASSQDASTLHEAALLLFERGEIPGSGSATSGPADASVAIGRAARLVACDASRSCGPHSPLTLSYCVSAGCTPGVQFLDALRENLPSSDFALVQWYYRWMNAQRARGG
jgi:hypothetical protein